MSSRERWTIYPLLFLALGVSLRDKLTSTVDLRSISCEELTIRSHDDAKRVVLDSALNHTGRVVVYGVNGQATLALGSEQDGVSGNILVLGSNGLPQVVIRSVNGAGGIETLTGSGVPQVIVQSTDHGGVVKTVDSNNQVIITLGHELDQFGLYGIDHKGDRTLAIPLMQRAALQPPAGQPNDPAPQNPAPQPNSNPQPQSPPQPNPATPGPTPQGNPQPNNPASPAPAGKPQPAQPGTPNPAETPQPK